MRSSQAQPARKSQVKAAPKTKYRGTAVQCPTCLETLAYKGDLPRHMRTHTKAQLHQCPYYPSCDFKAIQMSNLVTHLRGPHGEGKPLQCPTNGCPFECKDPASLSRHRKKIHKYEPRRRTPRSRAPITEGSTTSTQSPEREIISSDDSDTDAILLHPLTPPFGYVPGQGPLPVYLRSETLPCHTAYLDHSTPSIDYGEAPQSMQFQWGPVEIGLHTSFGGAVMGDQNVRLSPAAPIPRELSTSSAAQVDSGSYMPTNNWQEISYIDSHCTTGDLFQAYGHENAYRYSPPSEIGPSNFIYQGI